MLGNVEEASSRLGFLWILTWLFSGWRRTDKCVLASAGFQADVRALQKNLDARHQVDIPDTRVLAVLVDCSVSLDEQEANMLSCLTVDLSAPA
jgi:hypothetical protein